MLIVDLDKTLISCTTTNNELREIISKRGIFSLFLSLLKNKSFSRLSAKNWVSEQHHEIDYTSCMNFEVIELIRRYRDKNSKVFLASGSPELSAERAITALNVPFDGTFTSTAAINLKAKNKLSLILKLADGEPFDYVGDSLSDLVIFKAAKHSYLVTGSKVVPFFARIQGISFEQELNPSPHLNGH